MKVQQGIMQENIRETFRIETEKFRAELETIPQDEPLQILNQVQHIEPEIIETSTKSNNSKYFIIGGIAIAAIILLLILRRRK
jgi:LPXTG-motif cell wall-anchored protein